MGMKKRNIKGLEKEAKAAKLNKGHCTKRINLTSTTQISYIGANLAKITVIVLVVNKGDLF